MSGFHNVRCTNETLKVSHEPQARLFCRGNRQSTELDHSGRLLMEHQFGMLIYAAFTKAGDRAEREAATDVTKRQIGCPPCTLAAEKTYDTRSLLGECRRNGVKLEVSQDAERIGESAADARAMHLAA